MVVSGDGTEETSKVGNLSCWREEEGGDPVGVDGRQGKSLWDLLD